MAHPYPDLQEHPDSGLTGFPWAIVNDGSRGSDVMSLGPDGIAAGFQMYVRWQDLMDACTQILGFSWRDASSTTPSGHAWLRRQLPWQHPFFNHLVATRISSVEGMRPQGKNELPNVGGGGVGDGGVTNFGPWSEYNLAKLTIQFTNPNYTIRTDDSILDANGNPQEWLRYLDKSWSISVQMLTKESTTYQFCTQQGAASLTPFQGAVGAPISHLKLTRKWYQIPEMALFDQIDESSLDNNIWMPNGLPAHMLWMQTKSTNPITGYPQIASINPNDFGYRRYPILGTVNSPIGGGVDDNPDNRFLGCPMGTLRLESIDLIEVDLQLPPFIMSIPIFANQMPVSRKQYDVVFHWDFFDPPRSPEILESAAVRIDSLSPVLQAFRGHNLVPFSRDGLWYAPETQGAVLGTLFASTPFQYADHSDLFKIL